MSSKDYSPFTPGQPVPVEFFVGRSKEIDHIISAVRASTAGRLQVLFLTGERGIGKSSLARLVRIIADRKYGVLGLHSFLGGVTSLDETVRRVFDRLLKESVGKGWWAKIKEFFGDHIRQVDLFGVTVEFGAAEKELRRMVHDFAPALRNLLQKLRPEKKGILVVLDDINGLAASDQFANWLKSLVDEIATSSDPLPLCLMLVGLEDRRQSLVSLQPSLARVFDVVELRTWSDAETRDFFVNAFSKVGIHVEEEALKILVRFTGGFPVMAHEIGDATFNEDTDNRITREDALQGVVRAADIVGRKHVEPQVFTAIRSPRYRAILRKIASKPFEVEFRRRDLWPLLKDDERKVFDNFLARMKKLGVVQANPEGGPGAYRFTNTLHYLYFWLEAARAKQSKEL
ncbi:MAG TPA: ATP-binding protein [Thermogutta sp.]|mgnify:FL=1|nr:ATP-binding protein [Thermogutta sp.]